MREDVDQRGSNGMMEAGEGCGPKGQGFGAATQGPRLGPGTVLGPLSPVPCLAGTFPKQSFSCGGVLTCFV